MARSTKAEQGLLPRLKRTVNPDEANLRNPKNFFYRLVLRLREAQNFPQLRAKLFLGGIIFKEA